MTEFKFGPNSRSSNLRNKKRKFALLGITAIVAAPTPGYRLGRAEKG
jgi:hypothetical protein